MPLEEFKESPLRKGKKRRYRTHLGTVTYTASTALTGNVAIQGSVNINSNIYLTLNGFYLIDSGAWNNDGYVTGGNILGTNGISSGSAPGTNAHSWASSNAASGGAGGGGSFVGGNGGNTIVNGGFHNGGNGGAPTAPTVTNGNIVIWAGNIIKYMSSGGGGGAGGSNACPSAGNCAAAGDAVFGGYVQTQTVTYAGNFVFNGLPGTVDGAGGSGGGFAVFAYNSGLTGLTCQAFGGAGGANANGQSSQGGNGGTGFCDSYQYITYPIQFIYIQGVVYSANPATYGTTITANAICVPSTDSCALQAPLGTNVCTGTGSCQVNLPTLAVGSYTYYSNDLTAVSHVSALLTINQGTPTAILTVNGLTSGFGTIGTYSAYPANINPQTLDALSWNVIYVDPLGNGNVFYTTTTANSAIFLSASTGNYIFYVYTSGDANYIASNTEFTANINIDQLAPTFSIEYTNTLYGANDVISYVASNLDKASINLEQAGGGVSTVVSGNAPLQYDLQNWLTTGTYNAVVIDTTASTVNNGIVNVYPPYIFACNSNVANLKNTAYADMIQNAHVSITNLTVKEINLFDTTLNPLAATSAYNWSGWLNYSVTNIKSLSADQASSLGNQVGFSSNTYWSGATLLLCAVSSSNNEFPVLTGGQLKYTTANQVTTYQTFANEQLANSVLTVDNFYSPYQPNTAKFSTFVLQYGLNQIPAKVQIFLVSPNGAVTLVDFLNTPPISGTIVSLPNNQSYIFNIYSQKNKLLTIINSTFLYCPIGQICNLGLSTQQNVNLSTVFGIYHTCTYTKSANTLACVADDPSSSITKYWLTVNQTDVLSSPVVCNNSIATFSGQITCTGINTALHRYSYALYGTYAGNNYAIAAGSLGNSSYNLFGEAGLWAALIIIIVIGLLGLVDPIFLITGDILAFIVINWIGFLNLNIVILAQMIILGILYAYKIRF